jgi:hypothetical protein
MTVVLVVLQDELRVGIICGCVSWSGFVDHWSWRLLLAAKTCPWSENDYHHIILSYLVGIL